MLLRENTVLDEELSEIITSLRLLGGDVSDVSCRRRSGTLSAFANTHGGVPILGLSEGGILSGGCT
ncbi:hypothetical protein [Nonomuraea sp. LPB2021202275-12-8]|uniref:hypothetical protein n=1 Tax=Nonomuraea sp. LPB2021202275-12-8 TaxID=3120159 RepID=UPI00300C93FF